LGQVFKVFKGVWVFGTYIYVYICVCVCVCVCINLNSANTVSDYRVVIEYQIIKYPIIKYPVIEYPIIEYPVTYLKSANTVGSWGVRQSPA
jgi:hypothetical protein